jgi:hypothetical protein
MIKQHARFLARMGIGFTAILVTSATWAQQDPAATEPAKEPAASTPAQEAPLRQPPSTTDVNGKSVPAAPEKRVLADPDSKMYMPCRDPNESKSTDDASKSIKPNPKASVLSEEAAKQHGFKPSPHKVDCPKP